MGQDLIKKYRDAQLETKKRRRRTPNSVVLHTTGYGPGLQRIDKKHRTNAAADLAYADRLDRVLEYKCELLVGRTGGIYELTDWHDYYEYHTGSSVRRKMRGDYQPPIWWRDRFPELSNPMDLPAWKNGSPNSDSVGIDLLAPRVRDKAAFKKVQLESVAYAIAKVTTHFGILITDETVLDHSALDPIGRANKKGPWDLSSKVDLDAIRTRAKELSKQFGLDYDLRVSVTPDADA